MDSNIKLEFFSDYHKSLTDNLNHISDDLLKAKWFFLAAIAAVGTAYIKLVETTNPQIWFGFIAICLIGNMIFWLISEYTLSHAFLFRFIQSKLAKIEQLFDVPGKIKDPTSLEYFIKDDRLGIDYIIPDQFVPIYWGSTWLIIINTIVAMTLDPVTDKDLFIAYLKVNFTLDIWKRALIYLIISLPLIWKLWTYYCYKIDKFINENCSFEIVIRKKKKYRGYFVFPVWPSLIGALLGVLAYIIFVKSSDLKVIQLITIGLVFYFWPVIAGLFINILRTFFRLNAFLQALRIFTPSVKEEGVTYVVGYRFTRILAMLYNIT